MCSITSPQPKKQHAPNQKPLLSWAAAFGSILLGVLWSTSGLPMRLLSPSNFFKLCATALSFLASIMCCVNFYTGQKLRECSPLTEHIAALSKKKGLPSQCVVDLDKIANIEGLSQLWKDEVLGKGESFKILLTGVTGYVGRAFLFQLLREIANNEGSRNKAQHKVYVMARAKERKNLTAAQRLETLREDPMFAPYRKHWDEVVVAAQSGDLQEVNCGMNADVLKMISEAKITHVVHCAADVNFNRPLTDSASINISPALQLQALAQQWPTCRRFVHCSTAFVNPGNGSEYEPMEEKLFSLGKYDPQQLYDSMLGDKKLALQAKEEMAFPNNYVFTKCVAEHLVVRNNKWMELKIVRPAIVGPAWVLPEPGWNGEKPSTITALFLLWGTRVIRFAPLTRKPLPVVPVDVVAVGIIHAMIAPAASPLHKDVSCDAQESKSEDPPVSIRNLIWSHTSPRGSIAGLTIANECIPAAVMKHHFSSTETAISFALIDIVCKIPQVFPVLHLIFNLGPLYVLQFICWLVKVCGIKSVLEQVPVVKLLKFSDMITLYKPYMGRDYYFESSLDVPESMDMHQYCASLFKATHSFWMTLFPGTIEELHQMELLPRGRLDLWWALTQPSASFANRIAAYLCCKILRESYGSAQLDLGSVEYTARAMMEMEKTVGEKKHCVLLAPSYQSPMENVLTKYVSFAMAGLGTDVPHTVSDMEFNDSELGEKVEKIKAKFDRHSILAANLQESQASETFLKTLVNSPGEHDYTVVPLCMECEHRNSGSATQAKELSLLDLMSLYWRVCIKGKHRQSLGAVRVSYGRPSKIDTSSDFKSVLSQIQREHCRLLSKSSSTGDLVAIEDDLNRRNSYETGEGSSKKPVTAPSQFGSTKATVGDWNQHKEWIPKIVPYINESHPRWASYIAGGKLEATPVAPALPNDDSEIVLKAMCSMFDAADYLAIRAKVSLHQKNVLNPTVSDLVKEMEALDADLKHTASSFIFEAAASFAVCKPLSGSVAHREEDEKKDFQEVEW